MSPDMATPTIMDGFTVHDLSQVMTRTLPEVGMDRMTEPRVEEMLSVSALTAHF